MLCKYVNEYHCECPLAVSDFGQTTQLFISADIENVDLATAHIGKTIKM